MSRKQKAGRMTSEQYRAYLAKNGITPEMLKQKVEKALREGYDEGFKAASPAIIEMTYAAAVLALHKEFKFGQERCRRFLTEMDHQLTENIDSTEAIQKVLDEVGVSIRFRESMDGLGEKE